ncbi:MAG TPA: sigma-70 family RNA polymerase sigma factor [Vicinamibacterales bacterium]|nr:sigma-70 family RNA polymerase sigma factor [Vicinamibacterales bacterium]
MEPVESLFRRESGRIVAALTRIFGVHNLSLAEDVVQDAFCRAMEVWKFRGMPENPPAWLMAVAKNRALDVLRRERTARHFAPELTRLLESEWTLVPTLDEQLSPRAVKDDLLRMMFSCCDPQLREESQVALVLHLLCGFSVDEVAGAFVATHAAIEKRVTRAKKVLAQSVRLFDVADAKEFSSRLPAVQRALYLLFNEGYHGASPEFAVRAELCREAMRLTALLQEHPLGSTPATDALAALMCLNAARLPARTDPAGELLALCDQDRTRWDRSLIAEGERLLQRSARGPELTGYHVEAAIAWVHGGAARAEDTDWSQILALYDMLMAIRPSPVVALNRAIALAQQQGPESGLTAIEAIEHRERLARYPFLPAALGELELRAGRPASARRHFREARQLARNAAERRFLQQRERACAQGPRTPAGR